MVEQRAKILSSHAFKTRREANKAKPNQDEPKTFFSLFLCFQCSEFPYPSPHEKIFALTPIRRKYENEDGLIFSRTSPALVTSPVTFGYGIISAWNWGERVWLVAPARLKRMKEMNPSFHHSSEITTSTKVTQEPAGNKLLWSFSTVIHTSCICQW